MITDTAHEEKGLVERPLAHIKITKDREINGIYQIKEIVGQGTFGTVVHAISRFNGEEWAIKIIAKDKASTTQIQLLEREIKILKLVQHPHIIYLQQVLESPQKLYLVFELCNEELAKEFSYRKIFTEDDTRIVISALASAVAYLHQHDIVHRDLKLENILLTKNPNNPSDKLFIKVTDFGLSVVKGGVGYDSMLQEMCGTLAYMAPEQLSDRMYSHQCDVWAMGVIMYLLISGRFPFMSTNDTLLQKVILNQEPDYSEWPWKGGLSTTAERLNKQMLTKNPAFRITAAEVVRHPWSMGDLSDTANTDNVLEMMSLWKEELKEPTRHSVETTGLKSASQIQVKNKTTESAPLQKVILFEEKVSVQATWKKKPPGAHLNSAAQTTSRSRIEAPAPSGTRKKTPVRTACQKPAVVLVRPPLRSAVGGGKEHHVLHEPSLEQTSFGVVAHSRLQRPGSITMLAGNAPPIVRNTKTDSASPTADKKQILTKQKLSTNKR